MRPIRTTIQGFGPHEDTTVDWSKLPGPIAVTAPYGTGKTWTIEAVIAALYGTFAWYAGSIYDGLTQGGTGEGQVEIEFEHKGEVFRAVRTVKDTGKTRAQTACLYTSQNPLSIIAGPKTSDFDRCIRATIGDKETALATWFLSQNRKNDLCGQPGELDLVPRRRGVFDALIGADALNAIEKRVANVARKSKNIVEELEAQLAGAGDPAEILPEKKGELAGLRAVIETKQAEVAAVEQNLEEARTRLRDAEGGDDVLKAQIAEYGRAENALDDLRRRAENLTTEIEAAEKIAGGLEEAQKDVSQLEVLEIFRANLRGQKIAYEAWERYATRRSGMACELKASEALFSSLGDIGAVDQEAIDLSGRLEELRAEYKDALESNIKTHADNRLLGLKRAEISNEINNLKSKCESAEDRLKERPETLFAERCAPCPFVSDWIKIPEAIKVMEENIKVLQEEEKTILNDTLEIDIAAIQVEGERAKAARKTVEDTAKATKTMESARANHEAMKTAYAEYVEQNQQYADGAPCSDPRQELIEVQDKMETLAGASERVKTCESAVATVLEKNKERFVILVKIADIELIIPALLDKSGAAQQALADRERQRAATRLEVEQKQKTLQSVRGEALTLSSDITRLETQIEEIERRAVERQEKYDRVRQLRDDLNGYADLRQCFGPRGARQILIDAAAPDLEKIADDLFQRATGGRMRLRIATQKPLQDGSMAETFEILITDDRGERDALRYSGGQLQLIQILFRIAVAVWVGNLRGYQPDCLFLDEAFDRLGAEGTEDLLRVLEHLSDEIGLIVVVTHDTQIAARMRSQVRLEKRFGGVEITTS